MWACLFGIEFADDGTKEAFEQGEINEDSFTEALHRDGPTPFLSDILARITSSRKRRKL